MNREATAFEIVWQNAWVRAAVYVLLVVGVIWLLLRYHGAYAFALQVALVAYILAYVLNPAVTRLTRLRIGRPLAVMLIYFLLIIGFLFGFVLVGRVIVESGEFIRLIPSVVDALVVYAENFLQWLEDVPVALLERFGAETPDPGLAEATIETARQLITDFLAQAAAGTRATLQNLLNYSGSIIYTGVLTIVSGTFQAFLILITSAYLLYDFPRIATAFKRYVPLRWRPLYVDLSRKADLAVGGFIRGRLLVSLVVGAFIWIGLSILGVPLATSIAFIAAVLNLIPYLGPIIGAIPAVLLGLTVGPWIAVGAVAVFFGANLLEANVFGPMVMARTTNLHPVTVLLALLVGAGLLGLVGMLIVVPLVALAKVILEEYLLTQPAYSDSPAAPAEPPAPSQQPHVDV